MQFAYKKKDGKKFFAVPWAQRIGALNKMKKEKIILRKGIDKRGWVWYNTEEKEVEQPFSPDRQ